MMSKLILVFSLLGLISACVGQYLQNGQCDPNIELVEDFDFQRFLGNWYELARADNPDQSGDCTEYHLTNNTNIINMTYSSVNNNFYNEVNGTISQAVNGSARLSLTLPTSPNPVDFFVLSTDYDTVALAYSCRNVSTTQRSVHVWVLGRQRTYASEMASALINTTLNNILGVDAMTLRNVDHSEYGCYRLPVIAEGQPVVLPGQCDPNIPVVQNFDVARFLGVWHEISSYHSDSSSGNCIRAQYTLGDGVVNVLNSQVINQNLLTITGTANVSSTDNSARLSVMLNLPGGNIGNQELWILASDYTSFAISYSCVNISTTEKQVYSWILSRTRQLPVSSHAAINQTVNSILDLNYYYYTNTNQTDAGCFFYPEPVPNEPVIFRGQCESLDVQAMRNFDAARYMGLWHTIELYPAANQNGECSNAQYSLVDGVVEVVNSHVIGESLYTARALAYPVSTDGSAELIVQFPIPGTTQTVDSIYWVLDTDYDNYALVYSCSNITADEMRVTSWKLSRTKQLTPASNTAIDNAMNRTPVLRQQYYEVMNQSVQSCFYYPEPQPGVPVVFPGQCDDTVAVVPDFNFTQFAGLWYIVQSYPNAQYLNQCIRHQYTFVSNTQLNLTLSSVNDQFRIVHNATLGYNTTTNNGRLTVSIDGTSATNVPFWILTTDYTNYALAYACVNITQDFRAVWSWKFSRTPQLSTASNTAIDNAMTNNVVLSNVYYEDIDQSDRACFYLPDLEPGDPIILPGQCDTSIAGVPNFDVARYAGRWRLIESYQSDFQGGTCNVAEYTTQSNPTVMSVTNSQVVNLELATITGTANIMTVDGSGRLLFTFPDRGNFEYIILATDYDSYALGYGCVNMVDNQRRVYSWKMSRNNTLTQAAQNNMNQIINNIEVLNNRFYYTVNRTEAGCFYYPTPDASSSVRFRTQCHLNIPVVTNFNTERYLGLWHDIQSYPLNFQNGTCINTEYTLGNNAVEVQNTHVINETLFSISGSAVPASTDGTGILNVTFTIGGVNVTTNYWVMATDYDSYSFVYSCRPIDDEFVQVSSWKLSRTKALTAAANTAINNVMNSVPVLDQRYFVERNQTNEGCFYFPEPQPGVPVMFPGQCDNSIAAVPNFNMAQFAGIWYEAAKYPEVRTPGQCGSHNFTLTSPTTMDLQSTDVLNLTLNSRLGNVTFNSTDGSGRLLIDTAGSSVPYVPYWILSTDYTNFALAYSCVNVNSDYRAVWSWKLSRTPQLSVQSNVAINNAMSNIDVLDNRYYEDVDQSDQACFHLPQLAPGEIIDLPGQCDPTIRGIPNFNLQRFSGRWRLIESYGSQFQSGTCNIARYDFVNSTTIEVTNQQVVSQALASISGAATVATTDGSGVLSFTLEGRLTFYDIYVLDTDYDSYALLYGCENLANNQRRVLSWKFSRDNTLSQTAITNINRVIDSIDVLHQPYYYIVDRTEAGCFYYPEVNNYDIVRFRATCNQNIPVVTNFNTERYLGLWHDIQSYPGNFQDGTCNNAEYTLANNAVGVRNTHVINETLFSISGSAVPASADGTGIFNVTFTVGGVNVTTNYWVMATDYDSYSFVYSCRPIDDEYVQVSTWKLSRTKALTAAANTAINNVMNSVPVLDQRYFVDRNQTQEGCFYFPEPQPGVPVVFPGQCDNSIAAAPNFNMTQFAGIWYEAAKYPEVRTPGQCVSHNFALTSPTTMDLQSTDVLNLTLNSRLGNVTFNSTDGSGRLLIDTAGSSVPYVPYWILSTDYTNFALAYSCVNVNSDYRAVWSWKLSRTPQLSVQSNVAINNAMSNIDVLDNRYYEDVDQSDQACFHLPQLAPGEIINLPGQCDPTIRGVPNFNLQRFSGRWRLIESYGSRFQSGTCNIARYDFINGTSIGVTNQQVLSQALASISGAATVATTDGSGVLTFTLQGRFPLYDIYVLDTDYDSYALLYGCENLANNQRRVSSWKFSRDNTLSQTAITNINRVIDSIDVLHQPYYYIVDRTEAGCFYYPEVNNYDIVRFRATCNQNIPVVTNFNTERYLGLWHDIQSYPGNFQDGTCNNAEYTLGNNAVGVRNTHVINETLFSISGSAVPASADGTGIFNVTFTVGGVNVTTNYWVMATDYDSYSFVYSCRPIDDEYVQVSTWKLSRTKALTAAANTAINNVMNSVPVLDQRYFVDRNQTQEGCFYFPEPQPGVPVMFPGQCDNSIAAAPNFNMTQFAGIWYEAAKYPEVRTPGQCVSHNFALTSPTTMDLQSTDVLNLTLNSRLGNVTFNSTDGSGRLLIDTAGSSVPYVPYWILSTDYTNFALAYSCVNVNSDYRAVWSWKLSRTPQLSVQSNVAINNAMSNIDVLDNRYYEDVDQSDQACFHLPQLAPGEIINLPGQCDPTIRGVPNFNLQRFSGRWRLIESYGSRFQSGTCNIARYDFINGTSIGVTNQQVLSQALASISGAATVATTDGSGVLTFTLQGRFPLYDIYVLDTDYDSYALLYGCENLANNQRRVSSWKFSRANTLSQTAITNINRVIDSIDVLHQPYYYIVDRTEAGCFYYPEVNNYDIVRFRATCNQNIPVVTNFNTERYLGLWHDIQSYPGNFQDGTCNNAEYTLGNNAVGVRNTHVINQTLFSISGSAVPASADGTGIFNVTFTVGGVNVTTNYWVMATDYDSYSFVYSCRPIDDEYVQVSTWKLSRTKALTAAANTAINNVMNSVPVLDQRYFVDRNQTQEGCFYFPEPQPGVPVVFPGQCDNSIAAAPNFNMTQFAGIWYEAAKYPEERTPGQCLSHNYTLTSPTTMDLQSTDVLNLTLNSRLGNVIFNSTDGSGRLLINTAGSSVPYVPYWILSTDYTNYALAYSCVNINSDYRAVWSWKLSRTQQLSQASNTAINNAITNIDVLDNRYYENVDQSDNACFYLPVLGPNDPVVFPGQCDPNVPVLQNFNSSRYLGRWRLIESYYSEFQEGACNAATYSAAADGSVIVFNTKVVDQQLNTITGSAVPASNDGSGRLLVTFPQTPTPVDYWILDTDYDNYALIYTCVNISSTQRRVWSWKMSRSNTLTAQANAQIDQIVNRVDVLNQQYFQTINRTDTDCFYYPTPDGSNVIFPGQCDESIPVVSNFNANQYAGTWYDVESYPTNFQSGTCNTATYTLGANGIISVQNTQVVGQVLQTTSGYAVSATNDGSARLNVTFNLSSGDVSTNYWVLATDYSTYSLVYSCRNIDDEFRAVYSWKLGRQTSLSTTAMNAIQATINTVQVLEQQYYIQRNHTEEACFYYPDNNGGDVILDGQCVPDAQVQAVTNFNTNAFSGTWYEIARFPSTLQNGECANTQYSLSGDNEFNVVQTSVLNEVLLNTTTQATIATNGRGAFRFDVNGVPFEDIYILATDYSEYALAYSCRNLTDNKKQVYSWKLGRSRAGLSAAANNAINQVVSSNIDLFEGYYQNTNQDYAACFYYPVFDQLPPYIELPGPCNTTTRGVPNFNASAYLGRWFETARYPQPTQTGQCNRAIYGNLGGGLTSVDNSQVINASLSTISGTAVVASTDGSGVLNVTFTVGGESRVSNYYVLATDYDNYALVYSCANLPNGNRQVGSWQLSRSGTQTPQSYAVMEAVITDTQGLTTNYYQSTSQTDEACFYVPEVNSTQAPLFRGQCEDITGVAGFDAARFMGWWHEIERYPSDSNIGECISSRYETSNNVIQVVDTNVFGNLTAQTDVGTVTVSNNGRLRRVLSNNRVQDIWVLATDYDNYALLYSCENFNTEYRRAWSAKHSKTRSLTAEAQQAMAPVIQNNTLLYSQFYLPVDQSDSACFHYPVQTGSRVILPGQCDQNIPVVQSFNVTNFQGTWYQIQRYDAVQGSSCVGNRLAYDANSGDISMLAYEVVGGALSTANGSGQVSSTDGSARLSLVMPVADSNATSQTTLYILATDYENYALAYSCVNINSFERQVGAWQLSRERSLSASSVSAITAVIQQRQELYASYFNTISHEGECPEPSSAFLFKSSIIVILVCAVLQLVW